MAGRSPPDAKLCPELLWPRWADRLEATGAIGVVRCHQYNAKAGAPAIKLLDVDTEVGFTGDCLAMDPADEVPNWCRVSLVGLTH